MLGCIVCWYLQDKINSKPMSDEKHVDLLMLEVLPVHFLEQGLTFDILVLSSFGFILCFSV
jgi:hypothetical protein